MNRTLALAQLKKLGCTVESADNGVQAVEAWKRDSFDVVFIKFHMPEMDGFEATRTMRAIEQQKALASVRIFALTASTLTADRESCFAARMDDHLVKPVELSRIKAALDKVQKYCPMN